MTREIYPIILSGGLGSRLWPASREKLPKQFIPANKKQTFLILQSIDSNQIFLKILQLLEILNTDF